MKSVPAEVEKNVKIAIKASDFSSTVVNKVKEANPYSNIKEIEDLAKTAVNAIIEHNFCSHEEIYKLSGAEDKRKELRNESKRFKIKENDYPSTDSKFLSVLCEKLHKDVRRLEKELLTLQK